MIRSLGFICILASLLSACGGGGGGSTTSSVVPNPGGGAPQGASQAKITIVRPAAVSPSARSAKFIPATAQSIRVHVLSVNGATPDYNFFPDVVIALSTLNPACTTLGNGGLSCTVTVKVPQSPGVVLQISAYNSTDGSGAAVATLTTPPVDTTQPNPVITASLGGVPASLIVSSSVLTAPADGLSHPLSFTVNAKDSSGNLIMGSDYPTPAAVTISGDANGALSLGTTSVTTPGQAVKVTYDSTKALTTATINLAIPGTTPAVTAAVQVNSMIYSPANMNGLFAGGASTSVSVTEANNTGVFTFAGNGTDFTVTCLPSSCAPASAGGTVSMMITPLAAGTGTFTISDTNQAKASIPFTITGQTGGGVTVSNYQIVQYTPAAPAGQRPYGIAAGTDGKNLWFTDTAMSQIVALDTSTCTPTAATPTCTMKEMNAAAPGVWAIIAGSDGNMYVSTPPFLNAALTGGFSQVMSSASGCPSTSCTQNVIADSTVAMRPSEMARDLNGKIYALDVASGANNVIEFGANPPSTVFDAFAASATAAYGMIAVGPGSAPVVAPGIRRMATRAHAARPMLGSGVYTNVIWTDNATNSVVFQYTNTPSSVVTQEYGGFATGGFGGIASGSNGLVYVIETGANAIGAFSPSACTAVAPFTCTVTPIAIPTSASGAYGMTVGPDGNIWFTESAADKIGILNVNTNRITEIPIPGGGAGVDGPKNITVGPDGNMWFTEYNSGKIGEVVL